MAMPAADEYTVLCEEIRILVDGPAAGPPLALLEDRLTEGYARALALDAERRRLERRIGELGAHVGANGSEPGEELATLAARLSWASSRLVVLRKLLGALRRRTEAVRATAALRR